MKKHIDRSVKSQVKFVLITLFLVIFQLYAIPYTLYAKSFELKDEYAFGWIQSLGQGTNLLIQPIFAIAAIVVTLYFIIGGLQFLLSGGDKEAIAKAQKRITHAIIGFILLILLFLIMQFIPEFLGLKGFELIQ